MNERNQFLVNGPVWYTIDISVLVVLFFMGFNGVVYPQVQSGGETASYAKMIKEADLRRGRTIYEEACVSCHGMDGKETINPQARAFAEGTFRNGADPYSMFQTLTDGYRTMPSMNWLTPQERFDVIHYIREEFIKPDNPEQYVPVDAEYLEKLPERVTKKEQKTSVSKGKHSFGPGLSWRFDEARVALTMGVGENTTLSYDLHRMRLVGAWTGGFLKLGDTMLEKKRSGGKPKRDGRPLSGLDQWQWALNESFNKGPGDSDEWSPRGPAPAKWMQFHGRYRHGDRTVLSYRIGGRKVLELPEAKEVGDDKALFHTLEIGPGQKSLKLAVGDPDGSSGSGSGVYTLDGERVDRNRGRVSDRIALVSKAQGDDSATGKPFHQATAASVIGDVKNMTWQVDEAGRLVLHIPAGNQRRWIQVMRFIAEGEEELMEYSSFIRFRGQKEDRTVPSELTAGGPRRWSETVTVEGTLGEAKNGYALDTVPVPFDNPYGTWMRTAALAFFPDGRAVVTTYTGDVWIVSGMDRELNEVSWKRYAAGLYEPMGVQVKDGKIYVTTRYGIIRLQDLNNDGEADFYETFFADPDVRMHWHMFHFDLQIDRNGNFYYATTGLFNDFKKPPGAVMRVEPDGGSGEIIATGFRVPNGMGTLPDGRVLVSDNEGGWIPSSKISVVEEGAFYGYPPGEPPAGPKGNYNPPENFREPLIWMPQSLDSSSGGQMWAGEGFGPLSNRLLHTSFDPGQMYYVLMDEAEDRLNSAAVVALPHQFDAGIQRARQNPATGQVWATGLSGWGGPPGAEDGCLQRLRWTGNGRVVEKIEVNKDEILLRFNFLLDGESAGDPDRYDLAQWNYKWTRNYGSPHYSVEHPDQEGEDPIPVRSVKISEDQHGVRLAVDELQPVDQIRVALDLKDQNGKSFAETIYMTVHHISEQ